jgi:hypothetical protein
MLAVVCPIHFIVFWQFMLYNPFGREVFILVYLVSYDLCAYGQEYPKLFKLINDVSRGSCVHIMDSAWIIKSSLQSEEIYNLLLPAIDQNDLILVSQVTSNLHGLLPDEHWEPIQRLFL